MCSSQLLNAATYDPIVVVHVDIKRADLKQALEDRLLLAGRSVLPFYDREDGTALIIMDGKEHTVSTVEEIKELPF